MNLLKRFYPINCHSMANSETIYNCIDNFNNDLNKEIPRVIENIKYQYGLHSLGYQLDEPIVVSKVLDEVNLIIASKKTSQVEENTVYMNINPITLSTGSSYEPINIINKNIWVLFYKHYEKLIINLCLINIKTITPQDSYVCKQFYKRITQLPVMVKFNKKLL